MTVIVWGFLLRLGQLAIESALTLIVGAVTAGILRRVVGPAGTRRLFGRGWRGLIRGWIAGKLLPVCSLGVIPVAREMRRAGVPEGTILSFVLAAPLLNPISLLYGLTLAEPAVIATFAVGSLILSTAAGLLWDRLFTSPRTLAAEAERAAEADAEPVPEHSPRRMLAVAVTAARELAGRDLVYYAIGLTGSALLAAVIPFGQLQNTMHHSDPTSPLLMAAVALPVYSTPLPGMMRIGLMFDHGNSIGAAFVLFTLGIGTSLGTLAWMGTEFGWRRMVPWSVVYLGVILGLAYACEPLLYDPRKAEIAHTHAFDDYSCPFPSGLSTGEAIAGVQDKLQQAFGPLERPTVYGLAGLIVAGLLVRRFDHGDRVERWLTAHRPGGPAVAGGPWWNRSLPGPVLGGLAIAGLIGLSVIGAYVYYPDRTRCQEEMAAVRAETFSAVGGGHAEEGVRHLERWDLLVRKLEVGEYIRAFGVTPEQAKAAEDLREALEDVRDKLLAGDRAGAQQAILRDVDAAYKACKTAYPRSGE